MTVLMALAPISVVAVMMLKRIVTQFESSAGTETTARVG
jgi:hypothetical protein